ncbi:glycosyltransferase family 2 protein [Alishewanella longhuensis]
MNKNQAGSAAAATLDVEGASWDAISASWLATNGVPKVRLMIADNCKWLAIEGQLTVTEGDYQPRILCIVAGKTQFFPIPVTLKGTIKEVIALPEGVEQAWFLPLAEEGAFSLNRFSYRAIHSLKATWRMARRVVLYMARHGLAHAKRIGVAPTDVVTNLTRAYQRVGQQRAFAPALSYAEWLQRFTQIDAVAQQKISAELAVWQQETAVMLVLYANSSTTEAELQASLDAIAKLWGKQGVTYLVAEQPFKLALPETIALVSISELKQLLAVKQHWCLLIEAGALVASETLYGLLHAAKHQAEYLCWYSDHDVLINDERTKPQFKPVWSIELERSSHYLGQVLLARADVLLASAWLNTHFIANSYALTLRLSEVVNAKGFGHVPQVLWHQSERRYNENLSVAILTEHLQRLSITADVAAAQYGTLAIRYTPTIPLPLVSIIVPTRDMLCHLKPCIDSVLQQTDYANFELLVVDNQSVEAATKTYLDQISQDPRVSVLHYDRAFNYSAINNFAVSRAKGSLICLLNNDTEVITADWLTVMVGAVQQPNVAVVGAKLFYSDGRVQHAGDVVGPGGCADHLHSRLAGDAPGYMKRAIVPQDLSAVTAACLLTYKAIFEQLGGLNETALKVAFNDVDYCLRVRAAGYRVVFTPYAQLYHHESVSRGVDDSPEKQKRASVEVNYMQQTWQEVIQNDPFYHPNLNYARPDFRLSAAPRAVKPWLK